MEFSIIIPTYNSEKYIKSCLNSISKIDYPKNQYETIIVDGGSNDNTLNLIKKYKLQLLHSKNISISNSRNLAVKKAKGTNLVFIDSDCIVEKNILKISENLLNEYSCCGSFYKPSKKAGWIARTWLYIEGKNKGIVDWLPSGTLIVKKTAFNQIKGFNESLQTGEDFDFCQRLIKKGHKIYNEPKIASEHLGQTDNLKDFIKKEMWRGKTLIKSIKEHGLLKEEILSTIITIYHFLAICFFAAALFIHMNLVFLSIYFILLPSLLLAIRKVLQTKKPHYILKFYFLILIYQISRALSLIRYNQFKDIFGSG